MNTKYIHSKIIDATQMTKKHTVSRDKSTPSETEVFEVLTHIEDNINSKLLLSKMPTND